jgi:hypothetical protein
MILALMLVLLIGAAGWGYITGGSGRNTPEQSGLSMKPTDEEMSQLMETICSFPTYTSNPIAYIDAHAAEFQKMIEYGENTLRYCFKLFEQGGQTGLEGHIMAMACREILSGEDDFLLFTDTGQAWYDTFKAKAENIRDQNGDAFIQENMPGSWLLLQMPEEK